MQASINKYVIFLLITFFSGIENEAFSATEKSLKTADSLFAIGQYSNAENSYLKELKKVKKNNPNLLIKLAFLAEKREDYASSLYYLSCLAQIQPSVSLFQKMNQEASKRGLKGYEFNDFSYFQIAYRRYGDLLPITLLALAVYVYVVMVVKIRSNERVQRRHKWALVVYLLALLALLNVPDNYGYGIINKGGAFLRSYPSAAAPAITKIEKGHKVMVIGSRDHWNVVIWEKELVYIRKTDIISI